MHMVAGFILAALFRKKARVQPRLPSIQGKLELVHTLPGRLRLAAPLLLQTPANTRSKMRAQLVKIEGIDAVDIEARTGSLLIRYDEARIQGLVVHGIVIKMLGLEQELEKTPQGRLTRELNLVGRAVNQQIYEASGGLLDLTSSLMAGVLALALYQLLIRRDRALPGGVSLLWWTYILTQKGK